MDQPGAPRLKRVLVEIDGGPTIEYTGEQYDIEIESMSQHKGWHRIIEEGKPAEFVRTGHDGFSLKVKCTSREHAQAFAERFPEGPPSPKEPLDQDPSTGATT